MTDHDASPPPNLSNLSNPHPLHPAVPAASSTTSPADFALPSQAPPTSDNHRHAEKHSDKRPSPAHRAHKPRSSAGFLLADSILNRHGSTRHRDAQTHAPDKRQRRSIEPHTSKGALHGHPARPEPRHPDESSSSTTNRDSLAGETVVGSAVGLSPRASMAQLDMESAQIVNMALNLSESRRLASRRNIPQTPPKLAPLPDNAPGGSLRYHLQQQRKASRTVSPKPDRTPRVGGRAFTPLPPAFEPGTSYRYHFSQSTLSRAQKAKEYLELMAQYRRVLELVPQLEPERAARPWAVTPSGTPNSSAPASRVPTNEEAAIGRPYNPLQYVRNRKVRARERKAIDGEAQGFDDVLKVSEWIDGVAKWVATGQARQPGNLALPPFAPAEVAAMQPSPSSTNGRTAGTKPRRPRVDWVIDPADMLADVYWLELEDNKKLVEDRHWRRVFPQGPDVPRPTSLDEMPRLVTPGSTNDPSEAHTPGDKDTPEHRHDHEHGLSAARDRAQQKLRALKGSHRPTGSVANRDLLRVHRRSLSESSDTDTDRRRRGGVSTVRSLLEKQMEEMIAQEQREAESHPLFDKEAGRIKSAPMTPEREPRSAAEYADSRRRADSQLSEAEIKALKPLPVPRDAPQAAGRASLEVPRRRSSVEDDTSQPGSPNLRPTRDVGRVPAIGLDLSPLSSRPGSPHRNPLAKVKGIFRDRSRERIPEARAEDGLTLSPPSESWLGTPESAGSSVPSPQRRPSRSPLGHRPHKSLSSARLRGEGALGLRSLLRGPRIDTVLRSGVSKVSDMIWRKDGDDSFSTSSDDSDAESRGRSRRPRHGRSLSVQDAKNLMDAPQLLPDDRAGRFQHPPSRPISRRSSRFDLLKPPRIDVQNASPSVSPPQLPARPHDVGSDAESQAGDTRAATARLDAVLARNPRHWSIAHHTKPSTHPPTVSRREIAHLRARLLSAGIQAAETDRRARARTLPVPVPPAPRLTTDPTTDLSTAQTLAAEVHTSTTHFHTLSTTFTTTTVPALLHRVDSLRYKVAADLTSLANSAADAADDASRDLAVGQRLKVKRVVDAMEKMLRRRRRRFRWVRRAGWLVVEWLLVGLMWYVWFLVVVARVGLGVGRGVVRGVRWLLWL